MRGQSTVSLLPQVRVTKEEAFKIECMKWWTSWKALTDDACRQPEKVALTISTFAGLTFSVDRWRHC
jgi:hypothetical protein